MHFLLDAPIPHWQNADRLDALDSVSALLASRQVGIVHVTGLTGQSLSGHRLAWSNTIIICLPCAQHRPFYTVSQKNCTPKAGRHKFCYFPNTKNPKYMFCREFYSE